MRLRGNAPDEPLEAKLTDLDVDGGIEVSLSFTGGTDVSFTIERDSDELALLLSLLSDVASAQLGELGVRNVVVMDTTSWSDDDEDED